MQNTSTPPRHLQSRLLAPWLRHLLPVLVGGGASGAGILLDTALGIENRPVLYSDVFTGFIAGGPRFGYAFLFVTNNG